MLIGGDPPSLPVAIALWSGAITLASCLTVVLGGAVVGWLRGAGPSRKEFGGHLAGSAILLGLPCAVATFCAIFGGTLLIAVRTPPLAYLFVSLAGLAGLRLAFKAPGGGTDGCTKMIGLASAAYVAVWGLVAFYLTGGMARLEFDAAMLAWAKPPLAATPFALFITLVSGRNRNLWTFPVALAVLAAFMALCYLPVEAGIGALWLPAHTWLRFPAAGAAVGFALSATQLLRLVGGNPSARARALRALPRSALVGAFLGASTGLAWAAARAIVAVL